MKKLKEQQPHPGRVGPWAIAMTMLLFMGTVFVADAANAAEFKVSQSLLTRVPLLAAPKAPAVERHIAQLQERDGELGVANLQPSLVYSLARYANTADFGSKGQANIVVLRMPQAQYKKLGNSLNLTLTKRGAVAVRVDLGDAVKEISLEVRDTRAEEARAKYNAGRGRSGGSGSAGTASISPGKFNIDYGPDGKPASGASGDDTNPRQEGNSDPAEDGFYPLRGNKCEGEFDYLCRVLEGLVGDGNRDPKDGEGKDCEEDRYSSIFCAPDLGSGGGDTDPVADPVDDDEIDGQENGTACGPGWPFVCDDDSDGEEEDDPANDLDENDDPNDDGQNGGEDDDGDDGDDDE